MKAQDNQFVAQASLNGVRISPRKARLVVDLIRGKKAEEALDILKFLPKKAARMTSKLLESAIHNAKNTRQSDVDNLWIAKAVVNCGPTLKRFMPRAQGRATPIRKRSAHITIFLGEK